MPQLLDFNPSIIASVSVLQKALSKEELNVDAVRNVFLRMCMNYNKKFRDTHGEIILCCDSSNNWRKDIFPFYKASRKKNRAESPLDWDLVFECINTFKAEVDKYLPYKVVSVDRTEADDVIAVLAEMFSTDEDHFINVGLVVEPPPVVILSVDKDFRQLQRFKNVSQYSPLLKKMLVEKNPEQYLLEHIIRGDAGDGVPNILSADDVLITEGVRQKPIRQTKIDLWLTQKPEEFCTDDNILRNYHRNKNLVDLTMIPEDLANAIKQEYISKKEVNRSGIFNYLLEYKLKNIMTESSLL